jgi:hypothetical protein
VKDTEKSRLLESMFSKTLTRHRQAIALFSNPEAAGEAVDCLIFAGFPIAQVFLLGQTREERTPKLPSESFGTITGTATGLKKGMVLGNLFGGATGLLLGVGLIALPGVGQLMLSSAIAFTLLSGGIGTAAGGLMGALIGLGLTSEQAKAYDQQVSEGSILLVVEGTVRDIDRAQSLLKKFVI